MLLKKGIAIIIAILFVFLSACNLSSVPVAGGTSPDPAVETAAIQTEVAKIVALTQAVQTQVAEIVASTEAAQTQVAGIAVSSEAAQTEVAIAVASTLTAAATNTPEYTLTPSLTLAPTLTFTPTFTLTSTSPRVSVSVDTNCRSGPGTVYNILGVFRVGETAEIVGQDFGGGNWIIRLPSNPAIICWVWRNYATVAGDTGPVPVFTAQPTPTPMVGFVLTYDSFTSCGGLFYIKFKIANNGKLTWESDQVNVTDRTTSVTTTINRDNFSNYSGCVLSSADNNLEPGETGITTSNGFAANPSGHDFKATIQACSQEGQGGVCAVRTITFTP